MADTIKTYCHICREPIYNSDLLAGFAGVVKVKENDRTPVEVTIHTFHSREAQDLLRDEAYMEAVGMFITRLDFMRQQESMDEENTKELGRQMANELNLEFEKLELALKAFYGYSVLEMRKEQSDGDEAEKAGESGDNDGAGDRDRDDGADASNDGEDEPVAAEAEPTGADSSNDI